QRVEPDLASIESLLGSSDFGLVSAGLGLVELGLELRDRRRELARQSFGARLLLRVVALPVVVVQFADGGLHSAEPLFDDLDLVGGTLPISSQRRWIELRVAR